MSQITQQVESKVFTTIPADAAQTARQADGGADPLTNLPAKTPTRHEQHYFRDRRQSWIERMTDAAGGHRLLGCAAAGTFITGLWLATFTIGLSIPSQPFRDRLLSLGSTASNSANVASELGFLEAVSDVGVVAISFTPTNLAILCCVSALAGCLGRMATTNGVVERRRSEAVQVSTVTSTANTTAPAQTASVSTSERSITSSDADKVSPLAPAISAVTWGFFIYLVALSGTLIISGEPFKSASPEQYIRMASSASLAAFVVGWKPDILNQLLDKMRGSPMFGSAPAK